MIKLLSHSHLGASTVEAQEKVAVSVSEEIIEILTKVNVEHAVNAPKMDLSKVDKTTQSFIGLSTTIGSLLFSFSMVLRVKLKLNMLRLSAK